MGSSVKISLAKISKCSLKIIKSNIRCFSLLYIPLFWYVSSLLLCKFTHYDYLVYFEITETLIFVNGWSVS
jgi:hypothetical protein